MTNRQGQTRFLVCAAGTTAGLLLAYYLPISVFSWWIGALAGALVTGMLFSWKEIQYFTPIAARGAAAKLKRLPSAKQHLGDLFRRRYGNRSEWTIFAYFIAFVLINSSIIFIFIKKGMGMVDTPDVPIAMLAFFIGGVITSSKAMTTFLFVMDAAEKEKNGRVEIDDPIFQRRMRKAVWFILPVIGFVAILLLLMWIIWKYVPPVLPALAREILVFTVIFLKSLYLLTHSRERAVVMFDTGAAVAISYLLLVHIGGWEIVPTLAVGALLGGVLGIFHFQVASKFVTPRLQAA